MNADQFSATFSPPVTINDDGVSVIVRVTATNTVAKPVFQADALPPYEVRKLGNKPLVVGDICGSAAAYHDLYLRFVNVPGANDPHWELLNPGNVVTTDDLAAFKTALLGTARTVQYQTTQINNCTGNIPNGNCFGNPQWTPASGDNWAAWGFASLVRGNPSGFDLKTVSTANNPITSVTQYFGAYTLKTNTVGGDVYERTAQNCTVAPTNCYTNCNCNCPVPNCNCTCPW